MRLDNDGDIVDATTATAWAEALTLGLTKGLIYQLKYPDPITGYGASEFSRDDGTNQLGSSGSGIDHHHDSGAFSVKVTSECSWTMRMFIP